MFTESEVGWSSDSNPDLRFHNLRPCKHHEENGLTRVPDLGNFLYFVQEYYEKCSLWTSSVLDTVIYITVISHHYDLKLLGIVPKTGAFGMHLQPCSPPTLPTNRIRIDTPSLPRMRQRGIQIAGPSTERQPWAIAKLNRLAGGGAQEGGGW